MALRPKLAQGARALMVGVFVVANIPALAAVEVPAVVEKLEEQRIAAIAKAQRSAVAVFAGQGGGSGVVISADGYALTNFHVSKPAGNAMRCGLSDGNIYDAVIVGIDPTGDVALIKLFGREDFPAATLADSDAVRVGDWCFAIGNPFLLATDLQPTVSYGIVSGVHRYQYPAGTLLEYADCIQTDAAINPGNSGGPLFNATGDLIGINGRGSFEKRGRVNVGVGYAISINQIKHFLGYLRSGRIVDHATLGASVSSAEDGQAVVSDILETSDAYRRGLRYGDRIAAFGGRPIRTVNQFKNVLGIFPKGWRVPLAYDRDGVRHETWVRLAGVHAANELIAKAEGRSPDEPDERDPKQPGPKDNPPAPRPPGQKPQPQPPSDPHHPPAEMPEIVKQHYAARTGYANYHFNVVHRQRVWQSQQKRVNLTGRSGPWEIEVNIEQVGEATILLEDTAARLRTPLGETKIDLTKDLDSQLGPKDSGGLLVTLSLWRRMLLAGPEKYGETYYLGTAPLASGEPLRSLADVLVATHDVTESHWYFDPHDGRLLVLEMFPSPEVDPCEIHFGEGRMIEPGELPFHWEVRHGDRRYAVVDVKAYRFPPAAPK